MTDKKTFFNTLLIGNYKNWFWSIKTGHSQKLSGEWPDSNTLCYHGQIMGNETGNLALKRQDLKGNCKALSCLYLINFPLLPFHISSRGLATNMDEYVPTSTPRKRAREKS